MVPALTLSLLVALTLMLATTDATLASTEDLGNGFAHHGVATPVSNHRGIVATVDGEGRDVVLVWLFDHRGGYALLMIDAETGHSQEFPMPFAPGGDCPYASILSSQNKYYTHFNSHLCEFDPVKRAFTAVHATVPQMAMSMTEDDNGVIWSATYPQMGLASYDPKTAKFHDYGHLYKQNWAEYPRYVAADDAGWVYAGLGNTATQIIALDPATGKATPLLAEAERQHGAMAAVYRDVNGKVFGHDGGKPGKWMQLYRGERQDLPAPPTVNHKPFIASSQSLFHTLFPDKKVLARCDLTERTLVVNDPKTNKATTLKFDYTSEGAHMMGLCASPDGTVCGGTAFPMRFFCFDPAKDTWVNRESYGQWNTVGTQGDHYFVGGYTGGFLLDWDPAKPWVRTEKGKAGCNPEFLVETHPDINRPHKLLALRDGKTIVLAGTPEYGFTGGGLLFWDRETRSHVLLKHTDILADHSTFSLLELSDGRLLGGTTTSAGTGGEVKAKQAELYLMDPASKKLEWHEALIPGTQSYCDLHQGPKGLVYGVADSHVFFVLDPQQKKIVYQHDTATDLGSTNGQQGPRIFIATPKGTVYMLFAKGIVKIDPETYKLTLVAPSPVPIGPGGDYLKGRIYFGSGSHLYSWKVPE